MCIFINFLIAIAIIAVIGLIVADFNTSDNGL